MGRIAREGFDGDRARCDYAVSRSRRGQSKNCAIELAPASEAEPGAVAAARAKGRVKAQARARGRRPGSGKSRTSREQMRGEVTEEGLEPSGRRSTRGVSGRLASSNERTAREGGRRRSAGLQDDSFRADLGQTRGGQVAERGDSAVIRRSGLSDPQTQDARQGNLAMTVSRTGSSAVRCQPSARRRGWPARCG